MPASGYDKCLFCELLLDGSRTILQTEQFFVILDGFPVSKGHALIIPKRHQTDLFSLNHDEWFELRSAILLTKNLIDQELHPDGYNIGINCGESAGQTIFHLHIHIIPRYKGDVENPRGGIRNFKQPLVGY